jgi:predicted nucleotidyltransferase
MAKELSEVEVYELNEAYNKALIWFFSYPDRGMGLNDLSVQLEVSKTTANRVVKRLVEEGFLKVEELGRLWRISCNKDHLFNYSKKVPHNLSMIYGSDLLENILADVENARAIILFGSYRKGDDTEDSDIDIAVEVIDDEEPRVTEYRVFPTFGHRKDVTVNLYLFSRNKIDLNLFANIANGIVLHGFLEVRP